MSAGWPAEQLRLIADADELHIRVESIEGKSRRGVPIWVVCVGDYVYVRTWYRRDSGWFGRALTSHRAVVTVPGLEAAVQVVEIGDDSNSRPGVDAAYLAKYGRYGSATVGRMITDEAATTTLRLIQS